MEVEEPFEKTRVNEKVEFSDARGQPQRKSKNEAPKQVINNGDQVHEEEEKKSDVKTRAVYSYSWEDLKALRDSPASQIWPDFIEEDCVRNGIWDPEVWHHTPASAKRCASPVDEIRRQIIMEDGIVLSPQRQSFGQGCHVPQSAPERALQQDRTKSMLSRTVDRDSRDGRNRLTGRVGRGSRSLDFRANMRDRTTRNGDPRQTSPWERERSENDYKRNKEEDAYCSRKGLFYGGKKRYDDMEEPEWMTYGPTSQLETIELRGFNKEEMFGKRSKTGSFNDSTPKSTNKKGKNEEKQKEKKGDSPNEEQKDKEEKEFDINQFFISDDFLQFSDVHEKHNSNASRFCQFFGVGEDLRDGSRRSSTAEELLEYSGLSSGSPSTPRSPSPNQNFMFTPIKPVEANTEPESLTEMLEKTKIDVKPLLETVLSSGKKDMDRVKGPCRLEDIEKTIENGEEKEVPVDQKNTKKERESGSEDMTAFFKLVENMKTSGNLPEKPQPVIPGLPSRLLPRPPSPKTKQPRRTPSPLQKFPRSPSPNELLQHMMQARQIASSPTIPSPPQVVPQIDRAYSPYGITPMHKSIEILRRSPSPVNSMYDQPKRFSPLLTPDAFITPSPMHPYTIGNPRPHFSDKPRFELPNELPTRQSYKSPRQPSKPNNIATPKTTPKNQTSALRDLAFMPTSVLQKIKKDQMTPKSKIDTDETKKNRIENGIEDSSPYTAVRPHLNNSLTTADKQIRQPTQFSEQCQPGNEQIKSMFQPFRNEATLLKPTAFKPYNGMSPGSISPLRAGIHSEPQSPVTSRTPASPSHNRAPVPSSAPVTPQRHPHAEHPLLNSEMLFKQFNSDAASRAEDPQRHHEKTSKNVVQDKTSIANHDGVKPSSHDRKPPRETAHFNSDYLMQNEITEHHARQDHEPQRPMPMQHPMQQQFRRDVHNYNNMYRNRPTAPHMVGGHVSPQSILGSPGLPRSPYTTPNMYPGKQGVHPAMMRPPIRQPYLRVMPPRVPGMPLSSQAAALMQMMPQHPIIYGPGHTPVPGHHGYGPMNAPVMPPSGNYPVQRHSGFVHHQGKVASSMNQQQDPNPRHSPNDNVLSKWFSADVLRATEARTKIPPSHDKKVVSVEDLERQQTMFTALTL